MIPFSKYPPRGNTVLFSLKIYFQFLSRSSFFSENIFLISPQKQFIRIYTQLCLSYRHLQTNILCPIYRNPAKCYRLCTLIKGRRSFPFSLFREGVSRGKRQGLKIGGNSLLGCYPLTPPRKTSLRGLKWPLRGNLR